jgi:small multidrug resistance pump
VRRATAIFCEWEREAAAFDGFRGWFRAAAVYNLIWGAFTILFPAAFFAWAGMAAPNYLVLWQVVGMFVLVYAPGYWWASRDPFRFRHLILIGFLGKICRPVGFAWFAAGGDLPREFGWTILTNDIVWWPAFYLFLARAARACGGWWALGRGE